MKKIKFILGLCLFMGLSMTNSSCKTGEGCPTIDKYSTEVDLGNSKRGKSNLFSKKQRKKLKKRKSN
jgi:hypothetical protein